MLDEKSNVSVYHLQYEPDGNLWQYTILFYKSVCMYIHEFELQEIRKE